MAIKWTTVYTRDKYKFEAYCASVEPWTVIIREHPAINHVYEKSLTNSIETVLVTNSIETVLEHLMSVAMFDENYIKRSRIYQWCEGEGLFQLSFEFERCPHKGLAAYNVKWTKVADDLKAFEVLYG